MPTTSNGEGSDSSSLRYRSSLPKSAGTSSDGSQLHEDSEENGSKRSDRKWQEPRAAVENGTGVLSDIISFLPFHQCTTGESSKAERFWDFAKSAFPCLKWLPSYDTKLLHKDIIAGLTVGVMLVPQGMAYAMIAGLPPQYGLLYIYSFLGTSHQLAVGPVALISMMTEATLSSKAEAESPRYIFLATKLAFYCGIVQFVMGILHFGFVVNFLGHAVISGFTSGAAILIGLSQLKHLLGYDIKKSHLLHETMKYTVDGIEGFHALTFCTGLIWIACLLGMKRIGKTYPKYKFVRAIGPLTVCTISILTTRLANLDKHGVKIVAAIEDGFPSFENMFKADELDLLPSAAIVCLIGFLESIAIAKGIAAKRGYRVEATQELIALGTSNIFGSMFSSYPVTGSFSRSAVNDDTGAISGLSAVTTATLILFTLILLTPIFYFLPKNVLAAVVMSSVVGLVDIDEAKFLWRINKKDLLLWTSSFLGTLFLGVELGIGIAVLISLMFVIYETARPHVAVLGKLPGTNVYRSIHQYPEATTHEGLVIMRIDAPIYFANVDYIKDKLRECEALSTAYHYNGRLKGLVHYFIIEMTPVFSIDSSGVHSMLEIVKEFEMRKIQLVIANPNGGVMKVLETAGISERIGRQWTFLRCADAVDACLVAMQDINEPVAVPLDIKGGTQDKLNGERVRDENASSDMESPNTI